MMKRITAALLAAALFLTLTGCADASERQSRKTALRILRGDDLGYHLSTGTAVENQEVYNDGSIVIQLGGISGTPGDPQLVLAVKNGTRKEITFTPQRCFINGWQTDCWTDVYEIAGHSTITATVSISSTEVQTPAPSCRIWTVRGMSCPRRGSSVWISSSVVQKHSGA